MTETEGAVMDFSEQDVLDLCVAWRFCMVAGTCYDFGEQYDAEITEDTPLDLEAVYADIKPHRVPHMSDPVAVFTALGRGLLLRRRLKSAGLEFDPLGCWWDGKDPATFPVACAEYEAPRSWSTCLPPHCRVPVSPYVLNPCNGGVYAVIFRQELRPDDPTYLRERAAIDPQFAMELVLAEH